MNNMSEITYNNESIIMQNFNKRKALYSPEQISNKKDTDTDNNVFEECQIIETMREFNSLLATKIAELKKMNVRIVNLQKSKKEIDDIISDFEKNEKNTLKYIIRQDPYICSILNY